MFYCFIGRYVTLMTGTVEEVAMKKTLLSIPLALALSLGLAACTGSTDDAAGPAGDDPAAADGFPVEVQSCTETLTFDAPPERVLMLSQTDGSIFYDLDLMDTLIGHAGTLRLEGIDPEMSAAFAEVPVVEAGSTDTGGVVLSTEAIVATGADLVVGYDKGLDRDALREAGIKLYAPPAWCDDVERPTASWDLVDEEIDTVAAMFGVTDRAEQVKADNREALDALQDSEDNGVGVGVYVTPGVSEVYTYSDLSMVQPVFEANGLTNPYADHDERVFTLSTEDLLSKDPDWIVLLTDDPDAEEAARETFLELPGVDELQAVKDDQILHLPFILTDPPTTMSIEGAQELGEKLAAKK